MGLTIHSSLKASGSDARARQLIHTLHQTAQYLPLQERVASGLLATSP